MIGTEAYYRSRGTAPIFNFNGDFSCIMFICCRKIKVVNTILDTLNDLKRRMHQHQSPHQGYTGSRKWKLVYYEAYLSKEDARERKLKQDGRSRRYIMKRTERSQEICKI